MKRFLGYLLLGLGFIVFWPLEVVLVLSGLAYIVKTFLDAGVVAGLISIPIVGVILGVMSLGIFVIHTPLAILTASLLEKKIPPGEYEKIREVYKKEWEMASPEKRIQLERRDYFWYKCMEEGLNPKEADEKARQVDRDYWEIHEAYEKECEMASSEQRAKIERRRYYWHKCMEEGLNPKEADEKARQLN